MLKENWAEINKDRIHAALNTSTPLSEEIKDDAAQLLILNASYLAVFEKLKSETKDESKLKLVVNGMHDFKNQLEELRGLVIEFENNVKAFLAA